MARITISLPDALKDQLDATAEARNISVSELVQQALKNFFAAPPTVPEQPTTQPPVPQPINTEIADRLARLEKYVASLGYETEATRQGLWGISAYFQQALCLEIPCPPPIEPPPWPNTPPPWMHFKFK